VSSTAPAIDVADLVGGRRGVIDASAPGVGLVVVDTVAPLGWAIVAALVIAAAVALLRRLRREPLRQAAMGVAGLAGAAALAAVTGDAETYFLPGIIASAVYAVITAVSIAVGRPALGYVAALLDRRYADWRTDPRLRRAAVLATALWATLFTLRACVQGYLYARGHGSWLAPARLAMGLPLWAAAVAGSLWLLEGQPAGEPSGSAPAS
jgi:Protein of unknown function (DUF3159)